MSDVVLTNIVKQYEGAPAPAIRDLTLTLPSGEFVWDCQVNGVTGLLCC